VSPKKDQQFWDDWFGALDRHNRGLPVVEYDRPVDDQGCPCGPMPAADGYVHGCPVHDPNPPTRKEN
jgi:hypothetical protein